MVSSEPRGFSFDEDFHLPIDGSALSSFTVYRAHVDEGPYYSVVILQMICGGVHWSLYLWPDEAHCVGLALLHASGEVPLLAKWRPRKAQSKGIFFELPIDDSGSYAVCLEDEVVGCCSVEIDRGDHKVLLRAPNDLMTRLGHALITEADRCGGRVVSQGRSA